MPPTFASSTDFIQHGLSVPTCPICREDYNNTDGETGDAHQIVSIEKCGHQYHKGCLTAWVTDNNSCPTCRTTLYVIPPQQPTNAAAAARLLDDLGATTAILAKMLCQFRRDNVPLPELNRSQLDSIRDVEIALANWLEGLGGHQFPQDTSAYWANLLEEIEELGTMPTNLSNSDREGLDGDGEVPRYTQVVQTLAEQYPEMVLWETQVVRSIIGVFTRHQQAISGRPTAHSLGGSNEEVEGSS